MKTAAIARSIMLAAMALGAVLSKDAGATTVYAPTEVEADKLTVDQAADTVQRGFASCVAGRQNNVRVSPDGVAITWFNGTFFVIEFRDMQDIKINYQDASYWLSRPHVFDIHYTGHLFMNDREYPGFDQSCDNLAGDWAKALGDSLLRLKLDYDRANSAEAAAACRAEAARYRAMDPKPALPEDARRFRVQAEAAVQGKRFVDAARLYENGVQVAPWWPEGHYNRAVVLAEMQSFDSAITEMNCYLQLSPDAPDARQAQDQVYVWETHPFANK
jgi:tetratricopeptide (TPR) repeat protein